MQYCPFCGLEFPNNARFCGRCGHTPVARVPPNVERPPERNGQIQNAPSITGSPLNRTPGSEGGEMRPLFRSVLPFPSMPADNNQPNVPMVHGRAQMTNFSPPSNILPPVGSAAKNAVPFLQPTSASPQTSSAQASQASFPQTGSQTSPVYQSAMGLPPAYPLHTAHSGRREKKSRGSASKAVSGAITKWILIAFIFIIIAGSASAIVFVVYPLLPVWSETSTSTGSGNGSNHSLVDLTFSGAVTGHMSTEVVVTICRYNVYNGTKAYYFNVKDMFNGKKYDFFVSIYPYTGSGTYTERNVAAHLYYQTEPHGTVWNLHSPYIFKITGNSSLDTQGTVDAELTNSSANIGPVHISGSWRCSA